MQFTLLIQMNARRPDVLVNMVFYADLQVVGVSSELLLAESDLLEIFLDIKVGDSFAEHSQLVVNRLEITLHVV